MRKPHEGRGGVRLPIVFLIVCALAAGTVGYQTVQLRLGREEVRNFAEAKASELLGTKVKISHLRFLPLAQIQLKGVEIEGSSARRSFSFVQIRKISFGYGLINLIRGDFKVPSRVVLNDPQVHLKAGQSPFLFLGSAFSPSESIPAELVVENGEFRYPWGGGGKQLLLEKVRLKAKLDLRGQVRLELSGELGGVAQGGIEVKGFTDLKFQHYELVIQWKEVRFLNESGVPLKELRGRTRVSDHLIALEGLTGLFHDWKVQWDGGVEDWQSVPRLVLQVRTEKRRSPFRFLVQADLGTHELRGSISWRGQTEPFSGRIFQAGKRVRLASLVLPRGYTGSGEINRVNGNYGLRFNRQRRRFRVQSNISRLEFDTGFQLDHVSIGNLDWVISGQAQLKALPRVSRQAETRFEGRLKTDYVVVETEPMENLQGSFELTSEGVQGIDLSWGGVFHLNGRILLKGPEARKDMVLRVDGFPLETIHEFAGHPLPQNLKGTLRGKLKLQGDFNRPEVQGYFTIEDGVLENLEFDQAIIQFQGFPPYFKLYNSKILRGRTTFKLMGAINLSLKNIFHGIRIKGPDHLVFWRGISVGWKTGQSAIEAEKSLGSKMTMGLEFGTGDTQKDDQGETHALLGPKVKF